MCGVIINLINPYSLERVRFIKFNENCQALAVLSHFIGIEKQKECDPNVIKMILTSAFFIEIKSLQNSQMYVLCGRVATDIINAN